MGCACADVVALNVERDFVSRIRDEGLDTIPESERRGLTEPKAPSEAYLDSLAETFGQHLEVRSEPNAADAAGDDAANEEAEAAEASAAEPDGSPHAPGDPVTPVREEP